MGNRLGNAIMIYFDKKGNTQLCWPLGYDKVNKVVVLKGLREMARWAKELAKIKKFEDWKKDPGFKT